MTYDQILSTVGVSQSALEAIIIFAVIVIVVGFLIVNTWQYILAGFFVFGILLVFAHHEDVGAKKPEPTVEQTEKSKFMEDCVSLTQKESMCETLWQERWEN